MSGIRVVLMLTRQQGKAVLAAELSRGYGVRRPADLIEAERRLMAAVREALSTAGEIKK